MKDVGRVSGDCLCERIVSVLDEHKADDIACIDLLGRHSIFTHMVIASSKTMRHSVALADNVVDAVRGLVPGVQIEGMDTKHWISVDLGDVVLQIFLPEVRKYYDIDHIYDVL